MTNHRLIYEDLSRSVIGAFYEVYNTLGFGFLESVYVKALERELELRGHQFSRDVSVYVMYKGESLVTQRIDMIVDSKLVVEVKSTRQLHPSALRQAHNYVRATNLEIALLLHFGPAPAFHRLISKNRRIRFE
ncbi:MAG: GxxExxY protein [Gemmatimonadaceae bacterium]